MEVVILCGGRGTRLREETEFRPKPMVEIGGRPIIWHIMKNYAHFGYKDFILCTGYKGEIIKEYFLNYEAMNKDFTITLGSSGNLDFHGKQTKDKWKVTVANTGDSSMTGSRVKQIEKYITGEDFMLTYGDGLANINIDNLVEFHHKCGRIGTLTGVNPPARFGELLVKNEKVIKFSEKPTASDGYISGGFFVFKKCFFNYLSEDYNCVMEKAGLERLSEEDELVMYSHDGFWQCMDTYRDYLYLKDLHEKNIVPWQTWRTE